MTDDVPGRAEAADYRRKQRKETPADRGATTITTTPQQALSGTAIGTGGLAQCSSCARSIGEASEVALRAHRLSDEARWTIAAVYCRSCIGECGEIQMPTPGATELVVAGRLVVRSDAGAQSHWLVFEADEGHGAILDYADP